MSDAQAKPAPQAPVQKPTVQAAPVAPPLPAKLPFALEDLRKDLREVIPLIHLRLCKGGHWEKCRNPECATLKKYLG